MRTILNKGHRIRASDKNLVYRFSMGTLLFVFVAVILLLNTKQLMRTDWEHFSLLDNGFTLSLYNFITILIATGVCALVAFLSVSYPHLDVYKRQLLIYYIVTQNMYVVNTKSLFARYTCGGFWRFSVRQNFHMLFSKTGC